MHSTTLDLVSHFLARQHLESADLSVWLRCEPNPNPNEVFGLQCVKQLPKSSFQQQKKWPHIFFYESTDAPHELHGSRTCSLKQGSRSARQCALNCFCPHKEFSRASRCSAGLHAASYSLCSFSESVSSCNICTVLVLSVTIPGCLHLPH